MVDPHFLFSQKLLQIYERCDGAFLNHFFHAAMLAAIISPELEQWELLLWFCGVMLGGLWQWRTGRNYLKQAERYPEVKSSFRHICTAGVAGASFGLTACWFPQLSLWERIPVLLMFGAIAAGALPRLAALPSIYSSYLLGVFVPVIVVLIQMDAYLGWQIVPVLLLMTASLLYSARTVHADLIDTLLSKIDLETEAGQDKLTQIPNRRRFDKGLETEWRRAFRNQVPLSLILIDIDYFKKFNDRYGHQAGDQCLAEVAQTLAKTAQRASDLVARYGGEEFVVLLYHMTRDDAVQLADRMRSAVEKLAISHLDSPYERVTISMGGATLFPFEDQDPSILVEVADKALYRAKEKGRNRVIWQSPV